MLFRFTVLGHGLQQGDDFWSIVCLFGILFLLLGAVYNSKLWRPEQKRVPNNLKYIEGDYIGLIGSAIHHYPAEIKIELCGCSSTGSSQLKISQERCQCEQNDLFGPKPSGCKQKKPALSKEIRKLQVFLSGSRRHFAQKCRSYNKKLKPFRSRKESSQLRAKLLPPPPGPDFSDSSN